MEDHVHVAALDGAALPTGVVEARAAEIARETRPIVLFCSPRRVVDDLSLIAESAAGDRLLVGEVKWTAPQEGRRLERELTKKIERLPFVGGREVLPVLWLAGAPKGMQKSPVVTPPQVLDVLR